MKIPSTDRRAPANRRSRWLLAVLLHGVGFAGLPTDGLAQTLESRCDEGDADACVEASALWLEGRLKPRRVAVGVDLLQRACELDVTRCGRFAEAARSMGLFGEGLAADVRGCVAGDDAVCGRVAAEDDGLPDDARETLVSACEVEPRGAVCRAAARASWAEGAWQAGARLWGRPCARGRDAPCAGLEAARSSWERHWLETEHAAVEEELSLRWSAWADAAPGDVDARTAIQAIADDPRYGGGTLRAYAKERAITAAAWVEVLRWLARDALHRPGGHGYALSSVPAGRVRLRGARVWVSAVLFGQQEVTQALFEQVMGWQPVAAEGCDAQRGAELPVACVSWRDAVLFANALSRREQLDPVYLLDASSVRRLEGRSGYRLPAEAEWLLAAGAGRYPGGVSRKRLCEVGNVADRSAGRRWPAWPVERCDDGFVELAPVGSFRPTRRGLYDLVGNVREWMEDAAEGGRAVRGGAWLQGEEMQRTQTSSAAPEGYRDAAVGLRLVRDVAGAGDEGRGTDR